MSKHQSYYTGFLILCIGIMIGALAIIFQNNRNSIRSEVHIAEVKRSSDPIQDASYSPSNIFKDIAHDVTPTVVYIESSVPVSRNSMPDDDNHEYEERFWDRFLPERRAQTIGSGVLFTTDGYIITNNHVIAHSGGKVQVGLNDKRSFTAKVVGSDSSTDLAVLKIDEVDLPSAIIGNSDHVEVGDWVMAIGNPFRLKSTVTAGIVSARDRDVNIIDDDLRIESFIQTDAAINQGNSGGALVNRNGELIGINTAIATENGAYQGYGFAIPINMAIKIATDLIEHGEVQRPYLGVQIASIDQERAHHLGLKSIMGVEIVNLVEDGSAFHGGIKVDDIILEINGVGVNEPNELQVQIAMLKPGDVANFGVWRNGNVINLDIELKGVDRDLNQWARNNEELQFEPDEGIIEEQSFVFGITVAELARSRDFNEYDLVITNVEEKSEAWKQGLRSDYIILKINGNKVENLKNLTYDIDQSVGQNKNIILTVRKRDNSEGDVEIPISWK
ncbi:MAG: trypsin-like peptidase domain-containing protein [Balneolales bacterium]